MRTSTPVITDSRRRTQDYAPYKAIQRSTEAKLRASIRRYIRALRSHKADAENEFIARHVEAMADGYKTAYRLGIIDYFEQVSLRTDWVKASDVTYPNLTKLLAFYAPSVAKMAREIKAAVTAALTDVSRHVPQSQRETSYVPQQLDRVFALALDDEDLPDWLQKIQPRVTLQAELTWSAFQDGYGNAINYDAAKPYIWLYWVLEPLARHCYQCPYFADGSPYGAPGTGQNELEAVPGDGHSDCGAACKCGITYGPGATQDWYNWRYAWQNVPVDALWPWTNEPSVQRPSGPMNAGQKRALDLFRRAAAYWHDYQGTSYGSPDIGSFFEPGNVWLQTDWNRLTTQQQRIIGMIFDAIKAWQDASYTPEQIQEIQQRIDQAQRFDEVYELYNPYHDARGRFTSAGGAVASGSSGIARERKIATLARTATRTGTTRQCAWCGKLLDGQLAGRKMPIPLRVNWSHGMCSTCQRREIAMARRRVQGRRLTKELRLYTARREALRLDFLQRLDHAHERGQISSRTMQERASSYLLAFQEVAS